MVLSTSLERMCSRHTEDSGGVMRFVCSMDRLQVVATRQGCGIRITLPAAEPETLLDLFCSPLSGRTFQVDRFDLSSHLKIEVYLLLLVGLVTKVWRSIVDRKFIRGFGFDQLSCFRLGARWRSWVFGSKIALFVSLWAIILETMEKGNTSIAERYLNLWIMRRREIYWNFDRIRVGAPPFYHEGHMLRGWRVDRLTLSFTFKTNLT